MCGCVGGCVGVWVCGCVGVGVGECLCVQHLEALSRVATRVIFGETVL